MSSTTSRYYNQSIERTTSYGRRTTPISPRVTITNTNTPVKVENLVSPPKTQEEIQSTKDYLQTLRNNVNKSRLLTGTTPPSTPQTGTPLTSNRSPRPIRTYGSKPGLDNISDVPEEPDNSKPDIKVDPPGIGTKTESDEIASLKAALKKLETEKNQLETRLKNSTAKTGTNSDEEVKKLKKQVVTLTQRATLAEQTRDNLLQKWNNYEQEKVDNLRISELAEHAYQLLQIQNTKLSAEIELFKGSKQQHSDDMTNLKKLEDLNSSLQSKVDEITAELEKERADKAIVVADLRAKLSEKESSDRSMSITERLSNLPSHPKKELSDSRAEVAAKDRKIAGLEASLAEIQRQSVLLADQLNRMCDEVEKGEKIYMRLETVSKENANLKQEITSLTSEVQSLRDDLIQKENEISTLLDDNDNMVATLVTLGYKVEVGENQSLKITSPTPKATPPPPTVTSPVKAVQAQDNKKKRDSFKVEELMELSIDELLNG